MFLQHALVHICSCLSELYILIPWFKSCPCDMFQFIYTFMPCFYSTYCVMLHFIYICHALPFPWLSAYALFYFNIMWWKWIRWQWHMKFFPCNFNHLDTTHASLFGTSMYVLNVCNITMCMLANFFWKLMPICKWCLVLPCVCLWKVAWVRVTCS
jgi:hypothetical protein